MTKRYIMTNIHIIEKIEFIKFHFNKMNEQCSKYDSHSHAYSVYHTIGEITLKIMTNNCMNYYMDPPYTKFELIDYNLSQYIILINTPPWLTSFRFNYIVRFYDAIVGKNIFQSSLSFSTELYKMLYRYRLMFDYIIKYNPYNVYEDIFNHIISLNDGISSIKETTGFNNTSMQKHMMVIDTKGGFKRVLNIEFFRSMQPGKMDTSIVGYMYDKCFEFLFNKINQKDDPILLECSGKLDQIYQMIKAI